MNTHTSILGDPQLATSSSSDPARKLLFREFSRLEPLLREKLSSAVAAVRSRGDKCIRIRSNTCALGHKTYALAMIADRILKDEDLSFEIIATDSDPVSIATATRGLYYWDELKSVPSAYLSNHWVRGTGTNVNYVQAQDSIRKRCHFKLYGDNCKPDLGKFDLEIDESVSSINATRPMGNPIRVLCVDDSSIVLGFLKRILTSEHGFEVVATANNGLEATEQLRKNPTIDVMSLDIHMPEQTGLEYLQKNHDSEHPPVVMLTSVAREDVQSGLACLETGVKDYIEKSSSMGLLSQADEIRIKLRCAYQEHQIETITDRLEALKSVSGLIELSKSFAQPELILSPENKLRVIFAHIQEMDRLQVVLKKIRNSRPATLVLFHNHLKDERKIADGKAAFFALKSVCATRPLLWTGGTPITQGFYFANLEKTIESAKRVFNGRRIASMVVGDVDEEISSKVASWVSWTRAQLFIEDQPDYSEAHKALQSLSAEVLPVTSFIPIADDFLRNYGKSNQS